MTNRLFAVLVLIFAFLFNGLSVSSAAGNAVDPREAAIDRAIGGMEEGSRPLGPQDYAGKNQAQQVPGSGLSPSMDTRVTASANTSAGTGSAGANLSGNVNVGTEPGGSTEPATEPASGGGAGDGIINLDAGADLSGGSPAVDANLSVDTNASTLLDANATATTDAASTDITATESGTLAGQDLTTAVNDAPVDAILNTEVAATDIPAESEATAGLEADVDPVNADSDVTPTDPADGLSAI